MRNGGQAPGTGIVGLVRHDGREVLQSRAKGFFGRQFHLHLGKAQTQLRVARQQRHRLFVLRQSFRHQLVLQQHLAAQLMEIGIVRPLGDQAVQQFQRLLEKPLFKGADRVCVTRRQAVVVLREQLIDLLRRAQEPSQLGAHALMAFLQIGRDRLACVGRLGNGPLQEGDTIGSQRVGAQIGVLLSGQQNLLVLQDAKELQQSFGTDAGGAQIGDRRLIGGLLLPAREGKQAAQGDILAATVDRRSNPSVSGRDTRENGQQAACRRRHAGGLDLVAPPDIVARRKMAGFVCDHAQGLQGRFRRHQKAGMQEHARPLGHEGVEGVVCDQVHVDSARAQPGGLKQGGGVDPYGVFDFRVADELESAPLCRERSTGEQNHRCDEQRSDPQHERPLRRRTGGRCRYGCIACWHFRGPKRLAHAVPCSCVLAERPYCRIASREIALSGPCGGEAKHSWPTGQKIAVSWRFCGGPLRPAAGRLRR